jgi:hypothetical protein
LICEAATKSGKKPAARRLERFRCDLDAAQDGRLVAAMLPTAKRQRRPINAGRLLRSSRITGLVFTAFRA